MKRIVILGGGESGTGAAILAKEKGFDVFLSDMGVIASTYRNMLDEARIAWEDTHHTESLIFNADEIIKSPGIPNTAPIIKKALELDIPIISEIEFAARYTQAKMICITGSNGKTTTTSLIYHIFKLAGYNVGLAGNIGHSLALQVAHCNYDYYVIELSSFQLEGMYKFRANVAILLNITPDHLDRYENNMQLYVDAKMRIIRNQTRDDAFIYWQDDPIVQNELKNYNIDSHLCPFSEINKDGAIAYVHDTSYELEYPVPFSMEQEFLALPGVHNLYNQLAAGLAANILGINHDIIRQGLASFKGVPHRLEKVDVVDGVSYVNDSKATNVNACYYALESMKTPVVLILGGKDKGNDYFEILPLVKKKCRGLVFLGADNEKLLSFFSTAGVPMRDTHSMEECVKESALLAQQGDTVLLSPCCASFDLFKNMEDRGEQFIDNVRRLK